FAALPHTCTGACANRGSTPPGPATRTTATSPATTANAVTNETTHSGTRPKTPTNERRRLSTATPVASRSDKTTGTYQPPTPAHHTTPSAHQRTEKKFSPDQVIRPPGTHVLS